MQNIQDIVKELNNEMTNDHQDVERIDPHHPGIIPLTMKLYANPKYENNPMYLLYKQMNEEITCLK